MAPWYLVQVAFTGGKIDISALVRIADLFRFRWDPPILAVLAERQLRFRALHTQLESHIDEHVDDNALTRSLKRLTRLGMIRVDSKRLGNRMIKAYSLSDKGHERLTAYVAIITVYAHLEQPAHECDGCCVHKPLSDIPAT